MKKQLFLALIASVLTVSSSCSNEGKLDYKKYERDYNALVQTTLYSKDVPFKVSGTSLKTTDGYRLALSFDEATEVLPNIDVLVIKASVTAQYDKNTTIGPLFGYNVAKVGLGPTRDSINYIYPGLNLAFVDSESNPAIKISFKSGEKSYYISFNNFVEEATL